MKLFKRLDDAPFIFTALRVATVIAGACGTWFALMLMYPGLFAVSSKPFGLINIGGAVGLLTVAVASVCCYVALVVFFRMCGRLSCGTAFTDENAIAMRRIAAVLLIAGLSVAAGLTVLSVLLGDFFLPTIYLYGIAAAFLGAALLSHALAVLVRRAVALQQESELTI